MSISFTPYAIIHALKANSGMEPGFIFSKVIRNSGFTGLVRYKSSSPVCIFSGMEITPKK